MGFLELLILAVGLAMDSFAVSICKGLALKNAGLKQMCTAGIWFGGFQALMPCIGYFGSISFATYFQNYAHFIAFVLLFFIGAKMIYEAMKSECDTSRNMDVKTMFVLAVATSIDALAVGVSFAVLDINLWQSVAIIGIVTFGLSCIGIKIGTIFGSRWHTLSETIGGVILILLGLKILSEKII